jgi:hypothetical protein
MLAAEIWFGVSRPAASRRASALAQAVSRLPSGRRLSGPAMDRMARHDSDHP